jgi:hypothetical protein
MGEERVVHGRRKSEGDLNRRRHALGFEPYLKGRPWVQVTLRLAEAGTGWRSKVTKFLVDTGSHRTIFNTSLAAFVRAARQRGGLPSKMPIRDVQTLNGTVGCFVTGPVDLIFGEGSDQEFTVRVDEVFLHPDFKGRSVIGMDALTQAHLTVEGGLDAGSPGYNNGSTGWLQRTIAE